ncbi:MAG TPA: MarR family winged helix-turn-helix transcriptional regulator [Solirubrobacterales bacterium]|nr:MarR family winged helix-turn-helix transcriptional regulator [Solirubrobacterales bacterium]
MESATIEKADKAMSAEECLGTNLSWLLSQAHYGLASRVHDALTPLGISGRSYHVLAAALTDDYTQSDLAELVGLDKTTMVVTMDELERQGLAERRPSERDRRARVIAVTPAGQRKVVEAREVIERIQAEVLEALPARQREAFLRGLGEMVRSSLGECASCAPVRKREPK